MNSSLGTPHRLSVRALGAFGKLRERLDPRRANGGVFLGLNGIVIKSHGGTDAEGFAAAIELGYERGARRAAGQDHGGARTGRGGEPQQALSGAAS